MRLSISVLSPWLAILSIPIQLTEMEYDFVVSFALLPSKTSDPAWIVCKYRLDENPLLA